MREQDKVPDWALDHIRGQLKHGDDVINAVSFRKGLFSGLVLLNTSRGAALVTKGAIGTPQSALLTLPRDLMMFACAACGGRTLVIDVEPPADLHCTHCGARNHLLENGEEAAAAGRQVPTADTLLARGQDQTAGPYVHGDHTLYAREEPKKGGGTRTVYFFSRLAPRDAREADLPPGHEVVVGRDGAPRLKRLARRSVGRNGARRRTSAGGAKKKARKTAAKKPATKRRQRSSKKATTKRPAKKALKKQATKKAPPKKATKKPRKLTKKQIAQRVYAAQMKGVRKRAQAAKGGKGPVAGRSAAKRLRKELGLQTPKPRAGAKTRRPSRGGKTKA